MLYYICGSCFFFNDAATTEIYTLSLHDALPICIAAGLELRLSQLLRLDEDGAVTVVRASQRDARSEEHTSELQSPMYLVCRLLLEKKNADGHDAEERGRGACHDGAAHAGAGEVV